MALVANFSFNFVASKALKCHCIAEESDVFKHREYNVKSSFFVLKSLYQCPVE